MTRAIVRGAALLATAGSLGLELVEAAADVVLVDLADTDAVSRAAETDPAVPRIVLADDGHGPLLRALGAAGFRVAASPDAAAIGPLLSDLAPAPARARTRVVAVTGIAGGCGRTTLAVELALRLAERGVLLVDLTGSGAAAWRLGVEPGPWSDLEGLVDELTPEHVAIVAAERSGVRLIGGAGPLPSAALALAVIRASVATSGLVVVDAPDATDERAAAVVDIADRVLFVDPAGGPGHAPPSEAWLIARGAGLADAFHTLPDDPRAARSSRRDGVPIGGALGRSCDTLAEILAVDVDR